MPSDQTTAAMPAPVPPDVAQALLCPRCHHARLEQPQGSPDQLRCANPDCHAQYPILGGRPILINDANSVFAIADYERGTSATMGMSGRPTSRITLRDLARRASQLLTPSLSYTVSDYPPERALATIAAAAQSAPRILVVGAGDASLQCESSLTLVYTDVVPSPLAQIICDVHDIPFADGYFDAVIAVAVLEHVLDPYRCVDEIHRVLKPSGFLYAVTPFMQQVHLGRYDFTRFTHLGQRRLFRQFEQIASGIANGPGMALAWSIERFLSGFAEGRALHSLLKSVARLIAFPLKYLDIFLRTRRGAFDSASAFYFFGRKSPRILSDRELVAQYRGMMR